MNGHEEATTKRLPNLIKIVDGETERWISFAKMLNEELLPDLLSINVLIRHHPAQGS
jgi:hypothetical protein